MVTKTVVSGQLPVVRKSYQPLAFSYQLQGHSANIFWKKPESVPRLRCTGVENPSTDR
jgi:hypothetical protein